MNVRLLCIASLLAALLCVGCVPPAEDKAAGGKAPLAKQEEAAPELPDALMTPALRYYGFATPSAKRYSFTRAEGMAPQTGTQTDRFVSLDPETGARFRVTRTEALSVMGSEEIDAREDGLYFVSTSLGTLKEPTLVLPAQLEAGTTWDTNYEIHTSSGPIQVATKSQVAGVEPIETEGGKFDALLITQTAEMTQGEVVSKVTTKSWLVDGLGTVRIRIELVGPDGKTVRSGAEYLGPAEEETEDTQGTSE